MNSLIVGKIENLRKRLLDPTRRNKLIHLNITPKNLNYIRVIDELPDDLLSKLIDDNMRIKALPDLTTERPDEQTKKFQEALLLKRLNDEYYLNEIQLLSDSEANYDDKFLDLENYLRDSVRTDLGLPKVSRTDTISLPEHAKLHGIRPSYEMPFPDEKSFDGRHDDYEVQTMLLPERLDRISKAIKDRANSFIKETGINVVHTAFGVLEWCPANESKSFRSPVCLLESELVLKKSSRGLEAFVTGKSEPEVNTSLAHKLLIEHGINLPNFTGVSAEDFFSEIDQISPPGFKVWRVKREIIIGIFPSAKMSMYNDLDPRSDKISNNQLLKKLLTSTGEGDSLYAENYAVDEPSISKTVPYTVLDADSSQYSALIDAAYGKNLSIEGPPGSGKSQTIVNIISDAISKNKKVLFVAEKLTALNVVKNRLASVGLDSLILSLQHNKAAKESTYENISARIETGHKFDTIFSAGTSEIQNRYDRWASKRDLLNKYSETISTDYNETDKTIYEVIGDYIVNEKVLTSLPFSLQKQKIKYYDTLNSLETTDLKNECIEYQKRFSEVQNAPKIWINANALILNRIDAEQVCSLGKEIVLSLGEIKSRLSLSSELCKIYDTLGANSVSKVLSDLAETNSAGILYTQWIQFLENAESLQEAAVGISKHLSEVESYENDLHNDFKFSNRSELISALEDSHARFSELGLFGELTLDDQEIQALEHKIKPMKSLILSLRKSTRSLRFWDNLEIDQALAELEVLKPFLEKLNDLEMLEYSQESSSITSEYIEVSSRLSIKRDRLKDIFGKANGQHDSYKIKKFADTIKEAGPLTLFSKKYKEAISFCRDQLGLSSKLAKARLVEALETYVDLLENLESISFDHRYKNILGSYAKGLDTNHQDLEQLKEFQKQLSRSIFFKQNKVQEIFSIDFYSLESLNEAIPERKSLGEIEEELQHLEADLEQKKSTYSNCKQALSFLKVNTSRKPLRTTDLETVRKHLVEQNTFFGSVFEKKSNLYEAVQDQNIRKNLIELVKETEKFYENWHASLDDKHIIQLLLSDKSECRDLHAYIDANVRELENKSEIFFKALTLERDSRSSFLEAFTSQIDEIVTAIDKPEALIKASRLKQIRDRLSDYQLDEIVDWYENQQNTNLSLNEIVLAILAKNRSDDIFSNYANELNKNDGAALTNLRKEFAFEDRKIMELAKKAILKKNLSMANPPAGVGIGKASEYTDMSLLRHELNKKRRISIRDLTRRAFGALTELHPCWMMSPLAVSQYLPKQELFDLVIIDEASQLTPENAIGALIRSKQAIIVGDTKQLPPTNFFQSSADDMDEDEDLMVESESILDLANMAFTPIRQLKWHYRSKDASLIQFSNEWLYGNQLTIFPAANDEDPDFGVEIVEIMGEYKGRVNVAEARAVIDRVILHAKKHPKRSLGIATMNSDQMNLLKQELELEIHRNTDLERFINHWEEENTGIESLFIKNLETVQGDERDVIFISTLYGPEKKGAKVAQRFGPINSKVGHRRLNVLFSRAKEKMVTFTSLKPSDVLISSASNKGVKMFQSWLEYCKTGYISSPSTGGGTDSPFEDFVIAQIERLGCEAVPQVGAGGFRIDIGVKHPDYPYGYLLAVECDGATYHSSRSARDRDRLRQEILEGLGWSFHRIWSTDWFNDQRKEVEKLKNAIESELERKKRLVKPKATQAQRQAAEKLQSAPQLNIEHYSKPEQTTIKDLTASQLSSNNRFIEEGDIATVQNVENNTRTQFKFLNHPTELKKNIINVNSPLGKKFLDCEVGDEVVFSLQGRNRKVRILNIAQT